MLDQSRCSIDLAIKPLFLKDSLDMDDGDRDIIFKAVTNSKYKKIIITHGTDTMVQTAKLLSTINDKTIVLVGAMIPFTFKNSDALFNLGSAFGAVDILKSGVYICMNGRVFKWDEVKKDRDLGKFVSIN
jgi:L-asparaginase